MGLFFLPTLLVWSFSGCGKALLTGGLKQTAGLVLAAVMAVLVETAMVGLPIFTVPPTHYKS